jgi:signal transduction histidine kinase
MNLLSNATKFTPSGSITIRARYVAPAPPALIVGHVSVARPLITAVASQLSLPTPVAHTAPQPGGPPVADRPASTDGGWIAVEVCDTGIGIAASERERIFGEFEQVNAGPRGDSIRRGTGLGLAISRRLARLLGGDIALESDYGKGSTFIVWLPIELDAVRPTLQPDASEASSVAHGS